eukprot:7381755-Prymnesium_polylepis.1
MPPGAAPGPQLRRSPSPCRSPGTRRACRLLPSLAARRPPLAQRRPAPCDAVVGRPAAPFGRSPVFAGERNALGAAAKLRHLPALPCCCHHCRPRHVFAALARAGRCAPSAGCLRLLHRCPRLSCRPTPERRAGPHQKGLLSTPQHATASALLHPAHPGRACFAEAAAVDQTRPNVAARRCLVAALPRRRLRHAAARPGDSPPADQRLPTIRS